MSRISTSIERDSGVRARNIPDEKKTDGPTASAKADAASSGGAAEPSDDNTVRLSDISEIVSKYAVVDRIFVGAPQNEHGNLSEASAERDIEEETVFLDDENEDKDEPAAAENEVGEDDEDSTLDDDGDVDDDEDAELFASRSAAATLPAKNSRDGSLLFHKLARPRRRDELYSNWSSDARKAVRDMSMPQVSYKPAVINDDDDDLDDEDGLAAGTPVRQHKRALGRTVALCAALPIVAGTAFALTLYSQRDITPSELWGWLSASTAGTAAGVETRAAPEPVRVTSRQRGQDSPESTAASAVPIAAVSPEALSANEPSGPAAASEPSAPTAAAAQGSPATQIYMARLTVSDAQGTSVDPIPLALNVTRAAPEQRVRVRISGLPEGARLSAGTDLGNGEWALYEPDLENLSLVLPHGYSGNVTLYAMVIDDATHIQAGDPTALEVRVSPNPAHVVEPASARPNTAAASFSGASSAEGQSPSRTETVVPQRSLFPELTMFAPDPSAPPAGPSGAVAPVPQSEPARVASVAPSTLVPDAPALPQSAAPASNTHDLISKGDELLGLGDIASARLLYQRAASGGDPRAATAMGRTFDPIVFAGLTVHGAGPDPQQALTWYRRAADGGDLAATQHLQALEAWMKR